MHEKFELEHRNGKEVIDFPSISEHIRDKLKIIPKIQAYIFDTSYDAEIQHIIRHHGFGTIDMQVREYNRVKKVINNCIIPYGTQELLYVSVLRSILREMKMNYRMKLIDMNYLKESQMKSIDHDAY